MTAQVETDLPTGSPLSPAQLAQRWGVSIRTLEGWRGKGYGPRFRKFGSLVRYDTASVLDWESREAA